METTIEQIGEKRYQNITVDEIAKACGMSTGSAYRYFKNKKDMLIAALEYYYSNIQSFSETEDSKLMEFENLGQMLGYVLDQFQVIHKKYYGIHEELESLRHIDKDIKNVYNNMVTDLIQKLIKKCPDELKILPNLKERLYVAFGILERRCQRLYPWLYHY